MKRGAYLFKPGDAYRVRRSNYTDTPLPIDEPAGEDVYKRQELVQLRSAELRSQRSGFRPMEIKLASLWSSLGRMLSRSATISLPLQTASVRMAITATY